MWLRILSSVLVVGGLLAAAYMGWAWHRMGYEVMRADRQWPRPWPYPDGWLHRWERRLDAEERRRSAELGHTGLKIEGEEFAVRVRVGAVAVAGLLVSAAGLAPWAARYRRRAAARGATEEAGDYAEGFRPAADNASPNRAPAADPRRKSGFAE